MTRIRTMALCAAFVALSSCTTKNETTDVTPPTESTAATPPTEPPTPETEPTTTETEPTTPETEPTTSETEPPTTEPPPTVSINSAGWYDSNDPSGDGHINVTVCPAPAGETLAVPVAFVRDELIVAGDQSASEAIADALGGTSRQLLDGGPGLFLVSDITAATGDDLLAFAAQLRSEGQGTVAVDLNYLHPFLPNYRPHTGSWPPSRVDKPEQVTEGDADGTVAVIDTSTLGPLDNPPTSTFPSQLAFTVAAPTDPQAVSDVKQIGELSDVAGHGEFIAALVKRFAPNSDVALHPVEGRNLGGSGLWGIDEASIIEAIGAVGGKVNLSAVSMAFGGWGCAATPHLGLAVAIDELDVGDDSVFAAAGNESHDAYHFPAVFGWQGFAGEYLSALSSQPSISPQLAEIATKLVTSVQPVDVEALLKSLADKVTSVGSTTADGTTSSCFSNFGDWVETWAPGSEQVSWLPPNQGHGVDGWASWDGTSFATARALAHKLDGGGHRVMPTAVVPCPPPPPPPSTSTSVPTP